MCIQALFEKSATIPLMATPPNEKESQEEEPQPQPQKAIQPTKNKSKKEIVIYNGIGIQGLKAELHTQEE